MMGAMRKIVKISKPGPKASFPPYFRNAENVGGTPQEDEPTEHQTRCRSTHSNRNITIQDPSKHSDGHREVVVFDCKT